MAAVKTALANLRSDYSILVGGRALGTENEKELFKKIKDRLDDVDELSSNLDSETTSIVCADLERASASFDRARELRWYKSSDSYEPDYYDELETSSEIVAKIIQRLSR